MNEQYSCQERIPGCQMLCCFIFPGTRYSAGGWLLLPHVSSHRVLGLLATASLLHTHRHTCLTALFPGLPRWAGTRKVKPIWILLKQEIVSGSGISWAICKSARRSRQITTPAPHYSVFLQARYPSCRPTNSIKALEACICQAKTSKISSIVRVQE